MKPGNWHFGTKDGKTVWVRRSNIKGKVYVFRDGTLPFRCDATKATKHIDPATMRRLDDQASLEIEAQVSAAFEAHKAKHAAA